jgi:threonine dehydratase
VPASDAELTGTRLEAAHAASATVARRTPIMTARSLSDRCGGTIVLKAENLQRTGSFKLRGALNKVRVVADTAPGVVAGSAGNHAQSLAYAAREHGLRCEVFMPAEAAVSKVAAVKAFGATVHQGGASVDDCVAAARDCATETGLAFVHPFDDVDVIAGQAGVGLEIAEQVANVATVLVPVGGGGLAAGTAIALKRRRSDVRVIGVQARVCAPFPDSLRTGRPATATSVATIADGIAIKRPGDLTLRLLRTWLDDVVTVDEDAIAEAMVLLVERAKLVVEGAGAVSVAALLSGVVTPAADGATVAILSGGNVDVALLAGLAARHETRAGRRMRFITRVPDRPGGLADLLATVAAAKVNVLAVEHLRDGIGLGVRQTGVEFAVETRGAEHAAELLATLERNGYELLTTA